MGLRRIADNVSTGIDHKLEQDALIKAGAANEEVIGWPFATSVLSPGVAQPFAVGFKSTGGEYAGFRLNALVACQGCDEFAVVQFKCLYRRVVANLYPQLFCAAVIGVHEGFTAAHEEGIGTRHVQRARERRLKINAVMTHPVATLGRGPDHQSRQRFIGIAFGDTPEILPELLFGITLDQHILWRIVHTA